MDRSRLLLIAALLLSALAGGCASKPPLKTGGVEKGVTPSQVSATPMENVRVLWGGVIVATNNLKEATQIEVVGFPLDDNQEPKSDSQPIGRFLIVQPGYLESAEYAAGRRITVVGPVTGKRPGRIGETDYVYPVVTPDEMHLWPAERYRSSGQPQFHFGVGVGAIFR